MKRKLSVVLMLSALLTLGLNAQTSFTDDFNAGSIGAGWQGSGMYGLSQAGGILTVSARTTQTNSYFTLDMGSNINISANAVVNLKLRAQTHPYILRLRLVDASNATSSIDVRVTSAVAGFVNYCFDFSAVTSINKSQVRKIQFSANPDANSFGRQLCFEDLQIGTTATKFANLSPVEDVVVFKTKTAQKIYVTDIAGASAITVSGGATIIQNVTASAITGGVCTITYDCLAAGSAVITVTAVGSGVGNNTATFNMTVEDYKVPTVDQPADIKVPVGTAVPVKLTGISDGNESLEQTLTITAASGTPATVPNPTVSYTMQGSPYATLTLNAAAAGTAIITLTVTDNGTTNNTTVKTFNVTSYAGFNYAPKIKIPAAQIMYQGAGTLKVKLTGIHDGDAGSQTLTITAAGKNGVISSSPVTYIAGRDTAIVTLTAASLGKDTITVTVTDNGNTGSNNGNQSTQVTFTVEVLQPAPTGYKIPMVDFTADTTAKLWTIEGQGVVQHAGYVDTLGVRCLRIIISGKMNWTGTWFNIPMELNLTNAPYMSYEIFAKGFSPLQTHAYFWDVDKKRNATAAHLERDTITGVMSAFTKVFFDFRKPGYLNDDVGVPISINRIKQILFNYHDKFSWPNNTINGVVYIRDVRVGDSCKNIPAVTPVCTIDNVPTQVQWAGAATYNITLTGISNGKGNITGITTQLLSSKVPFIPAPTPGTIGSDGKAVLTYTTQTANVDSAQMIIRVSCAGSIQKEMRFWVKTASDVSATASTITVDATTKGQTITGFGTGRLPLENQLADYNQNLGSTFMRLFSDYTTFEANNDNNDPMVLDRSKLDKTNLNLDYIRKAHDAGVTDFFITLLSPPAWMMQSLSDNATEGAPAWNATKQKVDPIYYDEYVEVMVSMIRLIKEETGVEIAGICPQNEPAFTEPYGSGILDPVHMATVCGMLGKRLHDEGFITKVINSEQVFFQGYNPVLAYITAVRNDAQANQYTDIIGMHYPNDNTGLWSAQWSACKTAPAKELWATECTHCGNNFNCIIDQAHSMITGLNYGVSAWSIDGYNFGSSSDENSVNALSGLMSGSNKLKHYWSYKNFIKYIRKGAVQLKTTSSNANVFAASVLHTGDTTMTIVILNTDTRMPITVKLAGSAPTTGWDAYRTSFYERCEKVNPFKGGLLYLPPKSITTLVIKTNINHAPTADVIADVKLDKNAGTAVTINGIGCGDPVAQALTVTATSSNPAILPSPTVNYTSPANKATLILMPVTDAIGEVTMTVIIKDDGGRDNGGIDADTITFKVSVGMNALNDVSDKVSLYPNPASDAVNLMVPADLSNSSIAICNTAGQVMREIKLNGETQVNLNVSDLSDGAYYINISDSKAKAKLQFVKK